MSTVAKIPVGAPKGHANIITGEQLDSELFVGYDGNVCGAGEKAKGITDARFNSGEVASIVSLGSWPVQVGGTITAAGDAIASDGYGKAVEANIPAGSTDITGAELAKINGYASGVDPSVYPITSGYVLVELKV